MPNRQEIGTIDDPSFVWFEDSGETYLELQDSDGNVIIRFNQDESIDNVGSLSLERVSIGEASARMFLNTNQTVDEDTETKLAFDDSTYDDFNAFSTSENEYTIPADGKYLVILQLNGFDFPDNNDEIVQLIFENGSSTRGASSHNLDSANQSLLAPGRISVPPLIHIDDYSENDVLDMRVEFATDATNGTATITIDETGQRTYWEVHRVA